MSKNITDLISNLKNNLVRARLKIKQQEKEKKIQNSIIEEQHEKISLYERRLSNSEKLEKDLFFHKISKHKETKKTRFAKILDVVRKRKVNKSDYNLLKESPFFSETFYLEKNQDVTNEDPIKHYLLYGAMEGRNPSELFDTYYYLKNNKDVIDSDINPLIHFIKYGKKEKRRATKI